MATLRRCAVGVAPAVLIALTGAGVSVAATAPIGAVHAAPYPPTAPLASADSSTVCDGCSVMTTWTGYAPGSMISLDLFSAPVSLGSMRTNALGTLVTAVTIPAGTSPGSHTITGTGTAADGSPVTESIHITVMGAAESESNVPQLAHTGADLLMPAGIAAAAVGVGAVVVLSVRRRSTSNSAGK